MNLQGGLYLVRGFIRGEMSSNETHGPSRFANPFDTLH